MQVAGVLNDRVGAEEAAEVGIVDPAIVGTHFHAHPLRVAAVRPMTSAEAGGSFKEQWVECYLKNMENWTDPFSDLNGFLILYAFL